MPAEDQSSAVAPKPHRIEASFYNARGVQSDRIINSSDPNSAIDGKNRWYNYSFTSPVYLTQIRITTDGYDSYNSFELVVEHYDGTHHDQRILIDGNAVDLKLGKLCNGFKFRPESKFLSSPKITQVMAVGLTREEFHKMEWAVGEYEKNTVDLTRRHDEYKALAADLTEKQALKTALESEIGKSEAQLAHLKQLMATNNGGIEESNLALKAVQSDLEGKNAILNSVNQDISEAREELDDLTRQLRLFPSEISGFVKEGNRSTLWYAGLGLPFTIMLAIVMGSLFISAADLTVIWKKDPDVDIWTIFLTRIPFVVVAVTLVEACAYIVGRLVFEVIRINRQRLDFAKLSILAKDVSAASAKSTGMSDSEVFDAETKLKMELLREHMKNYTGSEFEYKGSAMINAIVGVAERFSGSRQT